MPLHTALSSSSAVRCIFKNRRKKVAGSRGVIKKHGAKKKPKHAKPAKNAPSRRCALKKKSSHAASKKTKTTTTTTTTTTVTTVTTNTAKNAKKILSSCAGKAGKTSKSEVYVLELQGGYVYVGKTSRGVACRLAEHSQSGGSGGRGATFTRLHPPTGRLLPRLGNLEGDGDGPERDETLRQMHARGPQRVRGWKYVCKGLLKAQDLQEIEDNIREMLDLCRKCGKKGHFAMQCGAGR